MNAWTLPRKTSLPSLFRQPRKAALLLAGLATGVGAQDISPAPVFNYEYDAQGQLKRTIQAKGVQGYNFVTELAYDRLGRIRTSIDARSGTTITSYAGQDQVLSVRDPRSLLTTYERDGFAQVVNLTSPDTGSSSSTYDAAGNLLTRLDSRGVLARFSYDALNRLTDAGYSWGSLSPQSFKWNYDEIGPEFANGIGRLTSTKYPGGASRYRYDPQGRAVSIVQAAETGNASPLVLETRYDYDAAGRVQRLTYPSGLVIQTHFQNGLPSAMTLRKDAVGPEVSVLSQIQHEPFGAVRSWRWTIGGPGQSYDRVFDRFGRLVRYPLGGVLRDVIYDAADRITQYRHVDRRSGNASPTSQALDQFIGYDELGRITSFNDRTSDSRYGYDANGNRKLLIGRPQSSAYTIDAGSNRLLASTGPTRRFSYDAAGNTVRDEQPSRWWEAGYDLSNRMATWTSSSGEGNRVTLGFQYNASGQRVAKLTGARVVCQKSNPCQTISPSAVIYVYDLQGHLLGEYRSQDGTALREYIWLGDTPVAVSAPEAAASGDPSGIFYIHADHLNAPRVILDREGRTRWSWLGDPFGTMPANSNPEGLGNFEFNLRFPGQYYDVESGLSYNGFRDFDPSIGRYVQSDPIGLAGGMNPYAYVGSSPTLNVDPAGLTTPGRPMPKGSELQQCPDPCPLIDKAIEDLIVSLKANWNAMFFDRTLYDNAYSIPNFNVTGTKTTWLGHLDNFWSVQRALKNQIANANRFNCSVSPEAIRWSNVLPPIRPGSSFGPFP